MKLIKSMLATAAALSISYLPAPVSANDNISVQNTSNLSILIPKNIDMGNADSASFSVQAKGKLNDNDIVTVSADKEVAMKRAGDEYYLNTATVDFFAEWNGSELNADSYEEKTGIITFEEKKVGTYTGNLNFTVTHKESYNISYDPAGGTMPGEYQTYYFSEEGLDSLPVPVRENYVFTGWQYETELNVSLDKLNEESNRTSISSGRGFHIINNFYNGTNSVQYLITVPEDISLYFNFNYTLGWLSQIKIDGEWQQEESFSKTLSAGEHILEFNYIGSATQSDLQVTIQYNATKYETIDRIPAGTARDYSLTATWSDPLVSYSINYDPNGGMMPDTYPSYYYSEEGLDYLPVPTKDGYTFIGWSEITPYQVDPSSEWTESGNEFTHTGSKQLVINFEISDSATLSFDFINQSRMAPMEYPRYNIYKDGSVITGQNLLNNDYLYEISHELEAGTYQLTVSSGFGNECTVSNIQISSELMTYIPAGSTGNRNLTAQWEPAEIYSINYDPAGGTMPAVYPTEYTTDKNVTLPTPVKEGYKFLGWTDTPYFEIGSTEGWEFGSDGTYTSTYDEQILEFGFWLTEPKTLRFEFVHEPADDSYSEAYYDLRIRDGDYIVRNQSLDDVTYPTAFIHELDPGVYELEFHSGCGESTISNVVFYGDLFTSIPKGTSGDLNLTAVWERIELSNVLETGARFSENIPEIVTNILFTDEIAPEGVETIDVSAAQDKGIVAWLDGTTWKVSTQRNTVQIIANTDCNRLFENAASLTSIDGLENIDFSTTIYAEYMFSGCTSLISIPLEEMDLSNVQYAPYMFKDCQSLDGIMTLNLPKVGNSETGWHIIGMFEGASINEGSILLVTGDDDSFTSAAVSTRTEPESKNYGVYLKIKDSYFTVDPESLEGVLENDSPAKITVTFSLKYGSLLYCYDPNDIHIGIQVESTDSEVILIDGADFWMMQEGVAAIVGTVTDADGTEYVRSCEITVTKG